MQGEDPVISKPFNRNFQNRIASQMNSRASPSANTGQSKASYSPGHWKKYLASQAVLKSPQRRGSNSDNNYYNFSSQNDELSRHFAGGKAKATENEVTKFQQQKRKKDEMMRRVEEIQKRVIPILKSNRANDDNDDNFGWYNRMQQRILKLQTNIDSIEKQLQIKMERRLLQMQREWNAKIQGLLVAQSQQKQRKPYKVQYTSKLVNNIRTIKTQSTQSKLENNQPNGILQKRSKYQERLQKIMKAKQQQNEQQFGENKQGYFTKRQSKNNEEDAEYPN